MLLILLTMACTSAPAPNDALPEASPAAPVVAPDGAPSAPNATEAEGDPPRGTIGGEPILPRPIVLGAIRASDVEAGVAAQLDAIYRCYEEGRAAKPDLSGKVLVRFLIAYDGTVSKATTKSTSLRHPPTEACVNERVAEAQFPALRGGRLAVVEYPFVFPAP